eukprot:NODE_93_length_21581_cov_0.291919.p6 type:complete len:277 gc:universal NODE_93_length_21581_cov_0.291919:21133-20303(-)
MKRVVVTGGNAGIGYGVAKLFKDKGFSVTIVGRSKENLESARAELGNVDIGICDLSNNSSIDAFVKSCDEVDVLVNNAGVWLTEYLTVDFKGSIQEQTFATNHLGTMYLTIKLMESGKLNSDASVVVVSSDLHKKGKKDLSYFDNLNLSNFDGMSAYSQSKLYNLLFSYYLVNHFIPTKYPNKSFKVSAVHPGFIPTTNLKRNNNVFIKILLNYILVWFSFTTTVDDGANRIYTAAVDPDSNGKYVGNRGYEEPSELAKNDEFATELWNKSVALFK